MASLTRRRMATTVINDSDHTQMKTFDNAQDHGLTQDINSVYEEQRDDVTSFYRGVVLPGFLAHSY